MTEAEIIELLKTHRISVARSRPVWTSGQARALYDHLSGVIAAERAIYPHPQQTSPFSQGLQSLEAHRAQSERRLMPLIEAQSKLLRENTLAHPKIHLIALPISGSTCANTASANQTS